MSTSSSTTSLAPSTFSNSVDDWVDSIMAGSESSSSLSSSSSTAGAPNAGNWQLLTNPPSAPNSPSRNSLNKRPHPVEGEDSEQIKRQAIQIQTIFDRLNDLEREKYKDQNDLCSLRKENDKLRDEIRYLKAQRLVDEQTTQESINKINQTFSEQQEKWQKANQGLQTDVRTLSQNFTSTNVAKERELASLKAQLEERQNAIRQLQVELDTLIQASRLNADALGTNAARITELQTLIGMLTDSVRAQSEALEYRCRDLHEQINAFKETQNTQNWNVFDQNTSLANRLDQVQSDIGKDLQEIQGQIDTATQSQNDINIRGQEILDSVKQKVAALQETISDFRNQRATDLREINKSIDNANRTLSQQQEKGQETSERLQTRINDLSRDFHSTNAARDTEIASVRAQLREEGQRAIVQLQAELDTLSRISRLNAGASGTNAKRATELQTLIGMLTTSVRTQSETLEQRCQNIQAEFNTFTQTQDSNSSNTSQQITTLSSDLKQAQALMATLTQGTNSISQEMRSFAQQLTSLKEQIEKINANLDQAKKRKKNAPPALVSPIFSATSSASQPHPGVNNYVSTSGERVEPHLPATPPLPLPVNDTQSPINSNASPLPEMNSPDFPSSSSPLLNNKISVGNYLSPYENGSPLASAKISLEQQKVTLHKIRITSDLYKRQIPMLRKLKVFINDINEYLKEFQNLDFNDQKTYDTFSEPILDLKTLLSLEFTKQRNCSSIFPSKEHLLATKNIIKEHKEVAEKIVSTSILTNHIETIIKSYINYIELFSKEKLKISKELSSKLRLIFTNSSAVEYFNFLKSTGAVQENTQTILESHLPSKKKPSY